MTRATSQAFERLHAHASKWRVSALAIGAMRVVIVLFCDLQPIILMLTRCKGLHRRLVACTHCCFVVCALVEHWVCLLARRPHLSRMCTATSSNHAAQWQGVSMTQSRVRLVSCLRISQLCVCCKRQKSNARLTQRSWHVLLRLLLLPRNTRAKRQRQPRLHLRHLNHLLKLVRMLPFLCSCVCVVLHCNSMHV